MEGSYETLLLAISSLALSNGGKVSAAIAGLCGLKEIEAVEVRSEFTSCSLKQATLAGGIRQQ